MKTMVSFIAGAALLAASAVAVGMPILYSYRGDGVYNVGVWDPGYNLPYGYRRNADSGVAHTSGAATSQLSVPVTVNVTSNVPLGFNVGAFQNLAWGSFSGVPPFVITDWVVDGLTGSVEVSCTVSGIGSGGGLKTARVKHATAYRIVAGVLEGVGSPNDGSLGSPILSNAKVDVVFSGQDAKVQVTGVSGVEADWVCTWSGFMYFRPADPVAP
jgi:hypothetical protein